MTAIKKERDIVIDREYLMARLQNGVTREAKPVTIAKDPCLREFFLGKHRLI
jgi:hypothetical protein